MSKVIAKLSLICWGFVCLFIIFLPIVMAIPTDYLAFVSAILGFVILLLFGFDFRRIYLREGFDFGWFLAVKKGYWRILFGLLGLSLLVFGFSGLIIPTIANDFSNKNGMLFVKLLVISFWVALTSTFLGWQLICLAEAVGYWRLGKAKTALGSLSLGFLWLLFALLFLSLFLEVINDVFLSISPMVQNRILLSLAIFSVAIGLWNGRYENLKLLAKEED